MPDYGNMKWRLASHRSVKPPTFHGSRAGISGKPNAKVHQIDEKWVRRHDGRRLPTESSGLR